MSRALSPEDAEYLRRSCTASNVPVALDAASAEAVAFVLTGSSGGAAENLVRAAKVSGQPDAGGQVAA